MMRIIIILTALLQLQLLIGQDLTIATFNCEFLNKRKVHIKYGLPYNIKYAKGAEKKLWSDDNYRLTKFNESTNSVADQIKIINADIIGLTEVGNDTEINALVRALHDKGLTYRYYKVCKSKDTQTGQHVAFLSKYDLKDIVTSFPNRGLYFIESDDDEVGGTGISKGMKVTVNVKGIDFHLFLFHFKSERGGEDSDQQRLMQAEIARRLTIPYIQKGDNVVLMGDFNSEKRHQVLKTIRGFNDINEELIQSGDMEYFEDYDTRWTYNYKGQMEQIDHILLSLGIKELCKANNEKKKQWGIKTKIIETKNDQVSDHNALVVELNFR
ncbi:endonuclease/exonuclease/phosphatase family protein [Aureispira]|nr:endonuclease/exonuclease/phosphatase family protein [Aureispira sp.]